MAAKATRGKDGKFTGSVGTGKTRIPTSSPTPTPLEPAAPGEPSASPEFDRAIEVYARMLDADHPPTDTWAEHDDDGNIRRVAEWRRPDGHLHRENGPAYLDTDGGEAWYLNGVQHREDGPAVIRPDGTKEWWTHGTPVRRERPPN